MTDESPREQLGSGDSGRRTTTELVTTVTQMTSPPGPVHALITTVSEQMLQSQNVHVNVTQELIVTTEDKFTLCLSRFLSHAEARRGWIAPLGILVTLLLTLVTASFRDTFGLSQYSWKAVFLIAAILSAGWLLWTLRGLPKSQTIEDVVAEMKKGSLNKKV